MTEEYRHVIIGAGLAGLSASVSLGSGTVVVEKEPQWGGTAGTIRRGKYWFDRLLHVLYFPDDQTEQRIRAMLGEDLSPCKPIASVVTKAGTVPFPIQMHLGELDYEAKVSCLVDLAEAAFKKSGPPPADYKQLLTETFGRSLADLFFLPYNRKQWKRPLDTLSPSGQLWNLERPDFAKILRSILDPRFNHEPYNANAWYPRPVSGSPSRGIQVLADRLAALAGEIRLSNEAIKIDPDSRIIETVCGGQKTKFKYSDKCITTIPLPASIGLCTGVPHEIKKNAARLRWNRCISVFLSIEGPRPNNSELWRYYADESLPFTRLIFMHQFDPLMAPAEGWSILAEIIEPAEQPPSDTREIIRRVRAGLETTEIIPPGCSIMDEAAHVTSAAYVVFDRESEEITRSIRSFLEERDVIPLGRYGRWEYSSMGQVIRDGFDLARTLGESQGDV